jgi:hypothetical protein
VRRHPIYQASRPFFVLAEHSLCAGEAGTAATLLYFAGGFEEGLEGIGRPLLCALSAISPVGRVALELVPLPMHTAVTRSLPFPTLLTRSISE